MKNYDVIVIGAGVVAAPLQGNCPDTVWTSLCWRKNRMWRWEIPAGIQVCSTQALPTSPEV